MNSFLRTFHPVGQGAFYTEQHLDGNEQLTVVYDCGFLTGSPRDFFRKVTSALPPGTVIDLLFISHFHEDHVNGLAELKKQHPIRAVVLPQLSEDARILAKLENYLEFGSSTRISSSLLDNPRTFFGKKTLLIFVESVQLGVPHPVAADDNLTIELSPGRTTPISVPPRLLSKELTQSASVPSGIAIRLRTKTTPFWEYVPFNYEYPTRHRELLALLATLRIKPDTLDKPAPVLTQQETLTAAYAKLPGKLNRNSLVVYSGPLVHPKQVTHNGGLLWPCWHQPTVAGCLYLGDAELKAPNMTTHLRAHLSTRWAYIGTLQVAHHGAVRNFSPVLVAAGMRAVISYGTDNHHGHPATYVVGHLHRLSATPVLVTEAVESGFYSHFEMILGKKASA